jgi:hypothetical protein
VDLSGNEYKVPATTSDLMYAKVDGPTITDLTTGSVDGSGVFDKIMASVSAHLSKEFEKGRISGAEYTKAYVELTQAALATASQYTLAKETAFWQAQNAQIAAITGRVGLESEKAKNAIVRVQAEGAKAEYALTKMKLATESAQYGIANFNLNQMLPSQKTMVEAQAAGAVVDTAVKTYTKDNILPAQRTLLIEQANVQLAQTFNTRSDGALVSGVMGEQRLLYGSQRDAYKKDGDIKVAKLLGDQWSVQKTVDDALAAPTNFQNAMIDVVLDKVRTNHGLT